MRESVHIRGSHGGPSTARVAIVCLLAALCCLPASAVVRFVDDSAAGANNGSSWNDAFTSLQSTLAAATSGDEVWVAAGTYKPHASDPSISFDLVDGVAIYGGFAGTETERSERDPAANITILSGDIGDGQDTYHVLHAGSGIGTSTIVDGVTIRDGSAHDTSGAGLFNQGGSPQFSGCRFTNNHQTGTGDGGGAVYQSGETAAASFVNCLFDGNGTAAGDGGAILTRGGTMTIAGCTFDGNDASDEGGAADLGLDTSFTIDRCVFSNNTAGNGAALTLRWATPAQITNSLFLDNDGYFIGAIWVRDSGEPLVVNSTFYGNDGSFNTGGVNAGHYRNCVFWNNGGNASTFTSITYSDVQGGASGTGNIDADPQFVDPGSGNLRLAPSSPCLDAGSNPDVPAGITTDLDGKSRWIDAPATDTGSGTPPIVDMGAYELYPVTVSDPPSRHICPGGNATLAVTADGWGALSFQWRRGSTPIAEGGHFSGTTTDTLTITGADAGDPGDDYNVLVTDSIGTQVPSSTASVTIGQPLAGVSGGGEICAGGSATIEADLLGIAPWTLLWSDGLLQEGVTDNPATREVSPSETTTYRLDSVTDANCAASSTGEAVVTVHSAPTAVVSGDASICAGASAQLHADLTGTPPFVITWSDGFEQWAFEGEANHLVTPDVTTPYTILSVTDAYCDGSASGSATITLPDLDPPPITVPASTCQSANYVASVPDAGPDATYQWSVSHGVIQGSSTNRVVGFRRGGTGTTTLAVTVTTEAGCATSSVPVAVNALPPYGFTLDTARACPGTTGLTASVPDAGEGATYEWTVDYGTITGGAETNAIAFDLGTEGAAEVRVRVTNASGCTRTFGGTVQPDLGLAVSERRFDAGGGSGSILLTTPCGWSASSNAPWLTWNTSTSGAGDTMLSFSVAPNPHSNPRGATLTVGGVEIPIDQRGLDTRDGRSLEVTTLAGHPAAAGTDDGPAGDARFYLAGHVAFDAAGNLFVADELAHTIRKIDTAGNVTTFAGLAGHPGYRDGPGTDARFTYPSGLVFDAAGNLYVSEAWWGPYPALVGHTIRKITPAGVVTTFAGKPGVAGSQDGPLATATFRNPDGLAFDPAGNLYVADMLNYTVRKITPAGVVSTLAGSPQAEDWVDGTGAEARFSQLCGITFDPASGDLFVSDVGWGMIRRLTLSGVVTTFAGSGDYAWVDGTGMEASFYAPWDLQADGLGNLYVADGFYRRVRRITADAVVTTIAGSGISGSIDGTGDAAQFTTLAGIDLAGDGTLVFGDGSRVRRVTPAGEVTTVAGPPSVPPDGLDGTGTDAWLGTGQMAFEPDGNIVLADGTFIRRVTPAGVVTTIAGGNTGSADGPIESAGYGQMTAVAVDAAGVIYVGDQTNRTIRRIADGTVTTIAGVPGVSGWLDGPGPESLFGQVNSLALHSSGDLYVADGPVVRRVAPDGTVSTVAGVVPSAGITDGVGSAARFHTARAVTIDPAGNLLVGDGLTNTGTSGRTIRRITPDGTVSTPAGRGWRAGTSDGPSSEARFLSAGAGGFDGGGNFYTGDWRNATIRMLGPDGTASTLAGFSENFGTGDGIGSAARFAANLPSCLVDGNGTLYISEGGRIRVATWTTPPPAPTAVNPTFGRSSGGTTVTIYGSGFQPGASVTFGGSPADDVDVVDPNTITVMMTPPHEPGLVTIVVTNPDERSGQLENAYTFNGPPMVTAVTPPTGSTNGGTSVAISGGGFRPGAIVYFGDMQLNDIVFVSGALMTAATFGHPEGTVNVTVVNPDSQEGTLTNGFHFAPPPSIGWIEPAAGPASGGTAVTIHGSGFQSGATIAFGGAQATDVVAFGGTVLSAITPPHLVGVVDVVVTNPDGQSETLFAGYTYAAPPVITSLTPQAGPSAGGTSVTIAGSGFQEGATVSFGGAPAAEVFVAGPTSITAVTPGHAAGAVVVHVVNPDGQTGPLPNGYTFVDSSDATLVAGSGSACDGQLVTIPIILSAAAAPRAVQFEVTFDPAKLTVLEVAKGAITAGFTLEANPTTGRVSIAMASATPAYSSTGEVARITFRADGAMGPGAAADLAIENAVVDQGSANSLPGSVSCAACARGDVNANGQVNAYDASLVLQIVVGSLVPDEAQACAADVNQNGSVTAFDASLVLQCVVGTGPCS